MAFTTPVTSEVSQAHVSCTRSQVHLQREAAPSTKCTTSPNTSPPASAPLVSDWNTVTSAVIPYIRTLCSHLCTTQVPGTSVEPNSNLRSDEIEIGLGIHNESGNRRISPIPPLNDLISDLIKMMTSTTDPERSFVPFKNDGTDRVVLLVNNLGGLSELELGVVVHETKCALDAQSITVLRVLAGTFMVRVGGCLRYHTVNMIN